MKAFQAVLLLVLLTSFSVIAQETVVAYGDSITRGWPYHQNIGSGERNGGYIPSLEAQLNADDWNVVVRNWGWPGQFVVGANNSQSGEGRINAVLNASNPNYVVMMEGTNDLQFGATPGTIANAIGRIVDDIQAFGAEPLLGTLLPRFDGNFATVSTNSLIRALAQGEEVSLVDFYSATSLTGWSNSMPDNLHPNTAGYSLMADTVFQAFSRSIKTPAITGAIYLLLLE